MSSRHLDRLTGAANYTAAHLSAEQKLHMDATMIVFMRAQPFFAYIMMERMEMVWTKDVPTAATDGVSKIFVNPEFFMTLTMQQRVFALAHEVSHAIQDHMPRSKAYEFVGALRGD